MADFQTIMLPFMRILSDGQEHSTNETNEKLAEHFNLTETDLNEYLPSGVAKTFPNRVAWAKSHLKMAGLIENQKQEKAFDDSLRFKNSEDLSDKELVELINYYRELDMTEFHKKGRKEYLDNLNNLQC